MTTTVYEPGLDTIKQVLCSIGQDIHHLVRQHASQTQYTDQMNHSGDQVNTLDTLAHASCTKHLRTCEHISAYASEEDQEIVHTQSHGRYIVAFDPLDGSKNASFNWPVGSIFAIFDIQEGQIGNISEADYRADRIVMSAYILYGTQTTMVIADGRSVDYHVWDEKIEKFVTSTTQLTLKNTSTTLSTNMLNVPLTSLVFQQFLTHSHFQKFGYSRCMVSDIALIIGEGGLFAYPSNTKNPEGKLRLLYECWPMAYIIDRLGGSALDDQGKSILDLKLQSLHQCSSLLIGSKVCLDDYVGLLSS